MYCYDEEVLLLTIVQANFEFYEEKLNKIQRNYMHKS